MATTFLEYSKMILDKVSFDHKLFTKEYCKAVTRLGEEDIIDLKCWLASRGIHPNTLDTTNHHDESRNMSVFFSEGNYKNRSRTT